MKKSSVADSFPLPEQPRITKTFPGDFLNKTITLAEECSPTVTHPHEELISRLNRIGHEYPFCIYYKQKTNDPL